MRETKEENNRKANKLEHIIGIITSQVELDENDSMTSLLKPAATRAVERGATDDSEGVSGVGNATENLENSGSGSFAAADVIESGGGKIVSETTTGVGTGDEDKGIDREGSILPE